MTAPRVAVIGGGLAGLAAACRLREHGVTAVVLEQSPSAGGALRTVVRDGWTLDAGPCMAAEPHADVRSMLDRAGITERTVRAVPAAATRYVLRDGRPIELPQTAAEFTSSSLLSLGGRLRLLKERFIPTASPPEETVDAFARRRYGDEVAERMFDPLLASRSSGRSDEALARYTFAAEVGHEAHGASGLQSSARERMQARRKARNAPRGSWSLPGGMQQFAEALAAPGDVRTSESVFSVAVTDHGASVTTSRGSERFDAVVLALPPTSYPAIGWTGVDTDSVDSIASVPCASIVAVSIGIRRETTRRELSGSRILIPAIERRKILSAVIPSNAFPDQAPPGMMLVTAFVGGARQPDLLALDEPALFAMVGAEIAEMLECKSRPVHLAVTRWNDALPQAVAGHAARLAAADTIEQEAPHLVVTGAWRDGLSVSEVLLGGVRAAERLASRQGWTSQH